MLDTVNRLGRTNKYLGGFFKFVLLLLINATHIPINIISTKLTKVAFFCCVALCWRHPIWVFCEYFGSHQADIALRSLSLLDMDTIGLACGSVENL